LGVGSNTAKLIPIEATTVRWDYELGNSQTILAESREAENGVS